MSNRVAIIGVGMNKFGELWDQNLRDITLEAGMYAIFDSGVRGADIDGIVIGNMSAGRFTGQEHLGAQAADMGGLGDMPAYSVEAACASGGAAVRHAYMAIKSGEHKVMLVLGTEKMSDVNQTEAMNTISVAADWEWEGMFGATFPALYAFMARRHMMEYGTTEEQLAKPTVKNHANAAHNPWAQFQRPVPIGVVMNSGLLADPLRVLHSAPITDGAAGLVMCSEDLAKKYTDTPVYIEASEQNSDTLALHDRPSITRMDAVIKSTRSALQEAMLEITDIDVFELHDSFSIGEIILTEDVGIAKKGEGGKALDEGITEIGGKFPVNTSGGLKARGHPVGATGVAQIVELALQLRGDAEKRQVDGAEKALAVNIGGTGATSIVHILGR
ncbi:MAG: acetyl-CoA acetyltransferase [Candidatus Thorarchaeota archaeon SMTZ-45]|nr:MAG: acetyl-CoA acetyltransferase [Candidatus Thorarchaeota archaeon SMTZ1-45]KXH76295.1 MAG: acetyl-CoA acetyltransferase [Candidatus Thorarchaeota archaeon SMTZ-45]